MSVQFLDGPAEGVSLGLCRAPLYLRVCRGRGGKWDALDQLDDEPRDSEQLFAYLRVGKPSGAFICCRGRNRKASGFYAVASYALVSEQPTDAEMRDTESWRTWCEARYQRSASPEVSS